MMIQRGAINNRRAIVVSGIVVVFMAVSAVGIFWYLQKKPSCCSNVPATNTANQDTAVTKSWKKYAYQQFGITVIVPPNVQYCVDGDNGFMLRNDACGATTKASIVVRRTVAWDAMDSKAAFDDAYGQQLKEVGMPGIGEQGKTLGGKPVSFLLYSFSDSFTGAIAEETLNATASSKKVAIDINRDVPLQDSGFAGTQDQLIDTVLQNIFLSPPKKTTNVNAAPDDLSVFTATDNSYSIRFPTLSVAYIPDRPADLSVTFGNEARLEVRKSANGGDVRGTTTGYRKLNEKQITVNSAAINEERFIPLGVTNTSRRLLYVQFAKGSIDVGVTFAFSGDPLEEKQFETILNTFTFTAK